MDAKIISYTSAYETQVADLASRVFGESRALNAGYIRWKYEENPYLSEPCIHIAVADGKVVGMRGYYGSRWHFGDQESWIIPTAGDFAVDEQYRGRWIAQRLIIAGQKALAARQFPYSISTSAGPTTRFLRMQTGCRLAAKYTYYALNAAPLIARQTSSGGGRYSSYARLMRRILNLIRKTIKQPLPLRKFDKWAKIVAEPFVVTDSPDFSTLGALATRFSNVNAFQHVRDEEFYSWRLRDPRYQFRCVYYKPGQVTEGFIMVQQGVSKGPLMISDWATPTANAWESLLGAVCGCDVNDLSIASTNFSPDYLSCMERFGFARNTQLDSANHCAPGILIDSVSEPNLTHWRLNGQDLLDSARWDMRMIYSDAF